MSILKFYPLADGRDLTTDTTVGNVVFGDILFSRAACNQDKGTAGWDENGYHTDPVTNTPGMTIYCDFSQVATGQSIILLTDTASIGRSGKAGIFLDATTGFAELWDGSSSTASTVPVIGNRVGVMKAVINSDGTVTFSARIRGELAGFQTVGTSTVANTLNYANLSDIRLATNLNTDGVTLMTDFIYFTDNGVIESNFQYFSDDFTDLSNVTSITTGGTVVQSGSLVTITQTAANSNDDTGIINNNIEEFGFTSVFKAQVLLKQTNAAVFIGLQPTGGSLSKSTGKGIIFETDGNVYTQNGNSSFGPGEPYLQDVLYDIEILVSRFGFGTALYKPASEDEFTGIFAYNTDLINASFFPYAQVFTQNGAVEIHKWSLDFSGSLADLNFSAGLIDSDDFEDGVITGWDVTEIDGTVSEGGGFLNMKDQATGQVLVNEIGMQRTTSTTWENKFLMYWRFFKRNESGAAFGMSEIDGFNSAVMRGAFVNFNSFHVFDSNGLGPSLFTVIDEREIEIVVRTWESGNVTTIYARFQGLTDGHDDMFALGSLTTTGMQSGDTMFGEVHGYNVVTVGSKEIDIEEWAVKDLTINEVPLEDDGMSQGVKAFFIKNKPKVMGGT